MLINIEKNISDHLAQIINQLTIDFNWILQFKPQLNLVVSGGQSPKLLFKLLAQQDLNWTQINISLVDERIVDSNYQDSNEYLVRTHLLQDKAKNTIFSSLNIDSTISASNKTIDCAILGMGEDGHTASIFAEANEFKQLTDLNNQLQYMLTDPISAKYPRISLTLAALIKIPCIYLIIQGANKLQVLLEALRGINDNYPISYLLNQRNDLKIFYTN